MAATIEQIMTGLETRLATISGLNVKDFAPGSPVFPSAFPLVPGFEYGATMSRGTYELPFRVAIVVSAALDRVGQMNLARYANQTGDYSIRAAIEGDKTLGGLVSTLIVDSFDPTGLGDIGLMDFFGGVFNIRIWASGV